MLQEFCLDFPTLGWSLSEEGQSEEGHCQSCDGRRMSFDLGGPELQLWLCP